MKKKGTQKKPAIQALEEYCKKSEIGKVRYEYEILVGEKFGQPYRDYWKGKKDIDQEQSAKVDVFSLSVIGFDK